MGNEWPTEPAQCSNPRTFCQASPAPGRAGVRSLAGSSSVQTQKAQVNGGCWVGELGCRFLPQAPVPILTAVAFGLLPLLDAWVTAVWGLIPVLVVLVAMVIEFTQSCLQAHLPISFCPQPGRARAQG